MFILKSWIVLSIQPCATSAPDGRLKRRESFRRAKNLAAPENSREKYRSTVFGRFEALWIVSCNQNPENADRNGYMNFVAFECPQL